MIHCRLAFIIFIQYSVWFFLMLLPLKFACNFLSSLCFSSLLLLKPLIDILPLFLLFAFIFFFYFFIYSFFRRRRRQKSFLSNLVII